MLLQVSKHHENEIDMKLKHSNRFARQYLLPCRHIFHLDSETKVLTEDRWHTYVALFEECGFEIYVLHPKYYGSDIRIRTGQEGIGNSSHGLRTAYRDRATDTVGARLGSTDSAAPDDPRPSTGADRESASAAAEKDNLGGHHKQSEGKQECK